MRKYMNQAIVRFNSWYAQINEVMRVDLWLSITSLFDTLFGLCILNRSLYGMLGVSFLVWVLLLC